MKTYILSSAPIQYQIKPYDLYDSFNLVSQDKIKAPLAIEAKNIVRDFEFPFDVKSVKRILTAEGGQTFETAKLIVKVKNLEKIKIVQTPNLNGVIFNMKELVSKKEFIEDYDTAIIKARKMFVTKFFNNELLENRSSVIERINNLLIQLKDRENTICISHSFYMKFLEIYINTPEKFLNLNALIKAFDVEKKPYKPLYGFYIN